jgi:hypothetical protein
VVAIILQPIGCVNGPGCVRAGRAVGTDQPGKLSGAPDPLIA